MKILNFPKPPRKENVWTREDVGNCFRIENQVTYEMQHDFDRAGFIDFMMIQSNVNVQIESGIKSEEDVRKWMEDTLAPIFKEKSLVSRVIGNAYLGIGARLDRAKPECP